jgi:ubiquitin-activating enzyme E1
MLKAGNYRIKEVDLLTTKMKAGNIIPALATTTAMIVGTVCSELYKIVQGRQRIEDY